MKIMEMKKEDFAAVPYLDLFKNWKKIAPDGKLYFSSFVIVPTENDKHEIKLHDSGWGCMSFCLVDDDNEPIGMIGGGSDVCNLDGIGGYGYRWMDRNVGIPQQIPVHGWTFDLLPCGYLNVWTRRRLFLSNGWVGSTFEVFSEDVSRAKEEKKDE